MIFAYGYGCCVFKHNICGDHQEVPKGMLDFADQLPPEFFVNLDCPLVQVATEATTIEASPSETTKEPIEVAIAED